MRCRSDVHWHERPKNHSFIYHFILFLIVTLRCKSVGHDPYERRYALKRTFCIVDPTDRISLSVSVTSFWLHMTYVCSPTECVLTHVAEAVICPAEDACVPYLPLSSEGQPQNLSPLQFWDVSLNGEMPHSSVANFLPGEPQT
ncbi:hypothetical protein TNCT_531951 [Trichonephila clavata]|uniref:Uncharacterized protein n=1 Tax=Trichonephila clavata TaxID=2740835 RepID=A0A8X6LSP5_TRICU|nr:hypothetical protein TNCT_531951 [Trichonephila clavata]